jgi:hypothetical protein
VSDLLAKLAPTTPATVPAPTPSGWDGLATLASCVGVVALTVLGVWLLFAAARRGGGGGNTWS